MANEQLEGFLASESAPAPEPAPSAAPEASPAAPASKPEAKSTPEPKAAAAKPEPEDDGEPPVALDGEPVIPRRAYEDERRKRQDWKERAARLEGELTAIKRQQEEARRPPSQQQQYQPPPDPAINPQGWAQHVVQQQQAQLLNERLNNSEMMLREKIGDEKVSEYVAEFRELANSDPTLFGKLYSQPHPYNWMTREVDRLRLVRDVGDDPAAFRAKIEAEARTRWEAEATTRAAPVSPAAGMQPSLANARSVAGRTAGQWSGEPSLEDVLSPIQNRKRPNGSGGLVRY